MCNKWKVTRDGQVIGVYSKEDLCDRLHEGKISYYDTVQCLDSTETWLCWQWQACHAQAVDPRHQEDAEPKSRRSRVLDAPQLNTAKAPRHGTVGVPPNMSSEPAQGGHQTVASTPAYRDMTSLINWVIILVLIGGCTACNIMQPRRPGPSTPVDDTDGYFNSYGPRYD